jgi:hypothetical protein
MRSFARVTLVMACVAPLNAAAQRPAPRRFPSAQPDGSLHITVVHVVVTP